MDHNGQEKNTHPTRMEGVYDDLRDLLTEIRIANYRNDNEPLVESNAFIRLEKIVNTQPAVETAGEDLGFSDQQATDEPFHIEVDLYDSGDYANLLVIPSAGTFIVVGNNEHLATLIKTCEDPACWEQVDGSLDDEVVELLGTAIDGYIQSF